MLQDMHCKMEYLKVAGEKIGFRINAEETKLVNVCTRRRSGNESGDARSDRKFLVLR